MKTILFAAMIVFIVILFIGVIYLTYENRDSNKLVLKVLMFFIVGMMTLLLTVLLQEKEENINYSTTTAMLIHNNGYPYVATPHLEEKDTKVLEVLSAIKDSNRSLEDKIITRENGVANSNFYLELTTRTLLALFQEKFFRAWKVKFETDELSSTHTWGADGDYAGDSISVDNLDLFNDDIFVDLPTIRWGKEFKIPSGTKMIAKKTGEYQKEIIFKNKYFTYQIILRVKMSHLGFGKYTTILKTGDFGTSHYYDIITKCTFSEFYPNNPMIKVYKDWVYTTNEIIDYYFNSLKNLKKNDHNREYGYYNTW